MDKNGLPYQFAADSQKIIGTSFVKAILYGSYARGDYSESSDIDLIILTTLSAEEIKQIEDDIYDAAYEYMYHNGIMISVNIINEEHFEYWSDTLPYYMNIVREGIVIAG